MPSEMEKEGKHKQGAASKSHEKRTRTRGFGETGRGLNLLAVDRGGLGGKASGERLRSRATFN